MGQTILITGTNSGFGKLAALTLVKSGHTVIGTMRDSKGRNRQAAEVLKGAGVRIIEMELTSDESVDRGVREAGSIDVLINNAGFGSIGLEETITSRQFSEQLDVNVVGAHRVLRAVLPQMRERKKGTVILVSSGLGRIVLPLMGAYAASKAALEAIADAYRYELRPLGIDVTIVQPGAFPTDFRSRLSVGADQGRAQGYGPFAGALDGLQVMFDQMLTGPAAQNPQDVADAIVSLVEGDTGSRPDRVVVDKMNPHGVIALNRAHLEVQDALLAAWGSR
jgi:NAD(P)-dependent dehydrogenase (short-subunit alcohol dehydrogenase family)